MKKITLLLAVILMLILSCGKKGNDKTTSKELNIYTWTYFIPQKVIDDFQKETGIKVNLSYYDSNDVMMTKLMSGAKGFDIISPSTDYVDILIKTGLIEKLDKTKLTNIYNNLDTSLRLDELSKIYDPGLEYSIPYTYSATGIVVNKKMQVSLNYRKKIRQEIYYIKKFGLNEHLNRLNIKNSEKYLNSLLGRILFVLQVDPNNQEFRNYKDIVIKVKS